MKFVPNVINLSCRSHDNFQWLVKQKFLMSFWPMGFKIGETDWAALKIVKMTTFSTASDKISSKWQHLSMHMQSLKSLWLRWSLLEILAAGITIYNPADHRSQQCWVTILWLWSIVHYNTGTCVTVGLGIWAHFMNGLWAHNHNLVKVHIALTCTHIPNRCQSTSKKHDGPMGPFYGPLHLEQHQAG